MITFHYDSNTIRQEDKTMIRKHLKKLAALLLCSLMVFNMTACGSGNASGGSSSSGGESAKTTKIRLAFPTWVGYVPLYIAQEKGFFKKYGLDVELSVIEGLGERKMALSGGQLDGVAISGDSLVNLKSEGMDVKLVYMLDNSNGSDGICAKKSIKSPKDLKGKRIAVEENMCEHFFLLKVLEQYGLSADDVKIVNMNTADAGAAYVAGEVDACVVYEPYVSQCKKRGANTFLTDEYKIPLVDVIGFESGFAEKNSEAVSDFIKAIDEADQYWEKNEDECAQICEKGLGISVDDCKYSKSVLSIYDLEDNIEMLGTEDKPGQTYDIVQDASDFYYGQGVISKEVKPEDLIDPSFIRGLAESK